ncbi:unnamed protein product [Caenorhabditis nigoni]
MCLKLCGLQKIKKYQMNGRKVNEKATRLVSKAVSRINALSTERQKLLNVSGIVEFENIHFCYSTRKDAKILDGFILTVEPGTSVTLVGHLECGKSITFKVLTGLFEQEEGQILIDGHHFCNKYEESKYNEVSQPLLSQIEKYQT